jgi:methylmalonyl-CoA mutase N-terminal domain/subunit
MVKAIEHGFPQKEIAEASYQYQRAAEAREKITVAANEFVIEEEPPQTLYIGDVVGKRQCEKLKSLRHRRDNHAVRKVLDALKHAASETPTAGTGGQVSKANTMPFILDAVRAYATVGEICQALREVYGTYEESAFT